jgi:hypothetical protein
MSEHHYGKPLFCFLPVYEDSEEEENKCVHCRISIGPQGTQHPQSHYTSHLFCFDVKRREAIEAAKAKKMFDLDLEETDAQGLTPLMRAARFSSTVV